KSEEIGFIAYKFVGDGWILLFPMGTSGEKLVSFLEELCGLVDSHLKRKIIPRLEQPPKVQGLTFGIDSGSLVRLTMMDKTEYIGRPINVASRLQSAIKEKDKAPAYKALFSNPVFHTLRLNELKRKSKDVTRTLRNIRNGDDYRCVKMNLRL